MKKQFVLVLIIGIIALGQIFVSCSFSGRTKKTDQEGQHVTNFDQANQFVKREYRKAWGELKL